VKKIYEKPRKYKISGKSGKKKRHENWNIPKNPIKKKRKLMKTFKKSCFTKIIVGIYI
jgi:hypothetical protein